MSAVVLKYPLTLTEQQTLAIPHHARILSAQIQREKLCVWALVDPLRRNETESRQVVICGTGHSVDEMVPLSYDFIDTVQQGAFVWHVFAESRRGWSA